MTKTQQHVLLAQNFTSSNNNETYDSHRQRQNFDQQHSKLGHQRRPSKLTTCGRCRHWVTTEWGSVHTKHKDPFTLNWTELSTSVPNSYTLLRPL